MQEIFQQALALQKAGRLDEAEQLYLQAAAWKPEWSLGNLGIIYRTTGRLDEAEAVLRQALAADPGNVPVSDTLGMTLLQRGWYAEGWRLYEARHAITPPKGPPLPLWQGESLAGRRIVVVAEQGLWTRRWPTSRERWASPAGSSWRVRQSTGTPTGMTTGRPGIRLCGCCVSPHPVTGSAS